MNSTGLLLSRVRFCHKAGAAERDIDWFCQRAESLNFIAERLSKGYPLHIQSLMNIMQAGIHHRKKRRGRAGPKSNRKLSDQIVQ